MEFDIENQLFTEVATTLRTKYDGIYVTGVETYQPKRFPCAWFMERWASGNDRYLTNELDIPYFNLTYEAQVFSNKTSGAKQETKNIMNDIVKLMAKRGFRLMSNESVVNINDTSINRRVARFRAVVDKGGKVYRR